jgi:CheY-like chemotaxis protein
VRRKTVLVVEDEEDIADSVAELLALAGHVVLVARDGDEALAAAERHRVDAVLLDWNLPGSLSGVPLVDALRKMVRAETPIIVCSADPRSFEEARDASLFRVLPKPYSHPALLRSLRPS